MTLSKLSLRNAKRQAKDYLIYFSTVVLAAALLYSFNGLVFSQEINHLSQYMESLPLLIVLASIVVVCIFGWLVSYSTRFMLARRSRELGTYILIGLTNRQVTRLFFLENLAVGGCALVLGLIFGGLLYQALRAIVLSMFGIPYRFAAALSLPATALTCAYFALIYLYALLRSRRRIRRMKIYDLIYFDKQNEGIVIHASTKRRFVFSLSIVLGILGTVLLMAQNLALGIIGAGCVIVFLFGFFLSFASGVPAFFDKRPAQKYSGQKLLIFRTLTSKLATMGILMATISMIFTATLMAEGTGMIFRGIFVGRAADKTCFDLYIGSEAKPENWSGYFDYIRDNIPVKNCLFYPVFSSENAQVMDYLDANTVFYHMDYEQDPVMTFGDYTALRTMAGYKTAELKSGQYLIHCMPYLEETLKDYSQPLTFGNTALSPGRIYTEHFSQNNGVANGRGYLLIIPDEAVQDLPVHHWAYAAQTVQPVTVEQFEALQTISDRKVIPGQYDDIYSKADEEAQVAAMTALTVFPMFYMALALTMTAAAILTIQQLSETAHYSRQFGLLRKLGMSRRDMGRALRNQFALYYAMPAVPPVLIGAPFILNLAKAPEPGTMTGVSSPAAILVISLGLFFLIYAVYILLAYTSLKRSVLPE